METFTDYGIEIPYRRTHGQVKCKCPKCISRRSNKTDRSLSVNLDKGLWHCHYCNWEGNLKNYTKSEYVPKKEYTRPTDTPQRNYSDRLISYLASRGISEATAKKGNVGEGKELMPPAPKSEKTEWRNINTIQFRYYCEGELINIKYRTGDKVFKLCTGAELIPYNIDSIKDTTECIITEGEFDCLSYMEAGFKSVCSVPNGANANLSYLDDFVEGWFDDKETIYIATDNDTKGIELRNELIRRFGAERCRIVTFKDCKDANELLCKYGIQAVKNSIEGAKDVPVDGVFGVADYEYELDKLFSHGLQKGKTIGHKFFDEKISFETKRLCVVTGVPSSGKSEFIDEICVRLCLLYGWRTAFFSPENLPLSYHASKLMMKITGDKFGSGQMGRDIYEEAKQFIGDNFCHILPPQGYTIESILELAKMQIRRKGVKIVVIDPFNRLESQQGSKSETQYISEILDTLTNFAQQNDVLVILMAHPRKVQDEHGKPRIPSLYDINGSANFYNKADYGIVVHRFKGEEVTEQYTQVNIDKVKFRHLGEGGKCYFKFNSRNGRYVDYDRDGNQTDYFDWDYRNYLRVDLLDSARPTTDKQEINSELIQAIHNFETSELNEVPF